MNRQHLYMAAFVVTLGIITVFEVKDCHDLPWPPRIVATAIVFGMLDLFSILAPELAGVVTIGIVLGALVNKGFSASCDHHQATLQAYSTDTNDISSVYGSLDTGSGQVM